MLVSETMLQQTRAEVVAPRFIRFMTRFPDLETLAAAQPEQVLAEWSGLGYYQRARRLHAAVRQIAASGRFPQGAEQMRSLPGIGEYTAAAVASIAFGEEVAAIDGNVERVISRRLAFAGDPKLAEGRRVVREEAQRLLDRERPGDSNQALMELGATVCLPRTPRCRHCPIRSSCQGHLSGRPESFPAARRRRRLERHRWILVFCQRADGALLLERRSDEAPFLRGAWQLPTLELEGNGGDAAEREARSQRIVEAGPSALNQWLRRRFGGRWNVDGELASLRHAITFRQIEARLVAATASGRIAGESLDWFQLEEIAALQRSSLLDKALERALDEVSDGARETRRYGTDRGPVAAARR